MMTLRPIVHHVMGFLGGLLLIVGVLVAILSLNIPALLVLHLSRSPDWLGRSDTLTQALITASALTVVYSVVGMVKLYDYVRCVRETKKRPSR